MTYGEKCNKEIKNDEWREHILSVNHLEHEGEKRHCQKCKITCYSSINSKNSQILYDSGAQHENSDIHDANKRKLGYYGG